MGRPTPANPVLRALDVARIYLAAGPASRRDRPLFADVRRYVSFIGHSRSGHSVVGALLDAHPRAAIAHEEKALQYVNVGFDRDRILSLLYRNAREVGHSRGRDGAGRSGGYTYDVEGQWQGRAERVEVIGDKHGEYNSVRFGAAPRLARRLRRAVGVPTCYVHVVRNPFDNVSTMARRAAEHGETASVDVGAAIDRYAAVCEGTRTARRLAGPDALYTLRHEAFVAAPADALGRLCGWLGLDAAPDYLAACAAVVFDAPHRSRERVAWRPEDRGRLEALIARTGFLRGYAFDT